MLRRMQSIFASFLATYFCKQTKETAQKVSVEQGTSTNANMGYVAKANKTTKKRNQK